MRKSIFGFSGIFVAALLVIALAGLSRSSVVASPPAQATMAATMGGGMAANGGGACPPGLASQIAQGMAASMNATPEMAATAGASATMAATMAAMTGTQAAMTGPVCLVAELKGSNEVPAADPDGSGFVAITVDPTNNTITFDVAVMNITLPAAANHIHVGAAGVSGPVVVPAPKAPDASGKVTTTAQNVDPALIQKILANPAGYYYNVHTSDFPNGALRGNLEVYDPADYQQSGVSTSGGAAATMEATPGG